MEITAYKQKISDVDKVYRELLTLLNKESKRNKSPEQLFEELRDIAMPKIVEHGTALLDGIFKTVKRIKETQDIKVKTKLLLGLNSIYPIALSKLTLDNIETKEGEEIILKCAKTESAAMEFQEMDQAKIKLNKKLELSIIPALDEAPKYVTSSELEQVDKIAMNTLNGIDLVFAEMDINLLTGSDLKQYIILLNKKLSEIYQSLLERIILPFLKIPEISFADLSNEYAGRVLNPATLYSVTIIVAYHIEKLRNAINDGYFKRTGVKFEDDKLTNKNINYAEASQTITETSEADKIIQQVNDTPPLPSLFNEVYSKAKDTDNPRQVYKVRVVALFYYYIHKSTQEYFENHPLGKQKAIEEVSAKYAISANTLRQEYNKISDRENGQIERQQATRANKSHLESVIIMLKDNSIALQMANADLKQAKLK